MYCNLVVVYTSTSMRMKRSYKNPKLLLRVSEKKFDFEREMYLYR